MKLLTWAIVLFVLMIIGYYIWAASGKDYSSFIQNRDREIGLINQGSDLGIGNIVGLQPYFTPVDYCDEQHFRDALVPLFKKAQSSGILHPNTIVVLPEYTGTWLALSNEKASVYQTDSLIRAIAIIVNSNIFRFIPKLFVTKKADLIKYAFFDMKARSMAEAFQRVFSSLAKEFKVVIVAGSIILPDPSVDKNGKIKMKRGHLYNAAFIFGPDGRILHQPIRKIFLSEDEKKFITPGKIQDLDVLATPAGKLAVLIGADGWSPGAYSSLQAGIIAVPVFSGSGSPGVLNKRIVKAATSRIHYGITLFYSGKLWEMNPAGKAMTLQRDSIHVFEPVENQARIINVWLQ